ncbi:MAG: site-specific integrase [Streptosporangiaceae bacterium]
MESIKYDPCAPVVVGAEWSVYRTGGVPVIRPGFDGLLDRWSDIAERERRLGVCEGTPILIGPDGRVDARLAYFARRSAFARLASSTQDSYLKDLRLFFTFLWSRGKSWDQADHEDIDDYEWWRRRSPDNPRRIGGAKWSRELAAFVLLYDWAAGAGHLPRSPVLTHPARARDGTTARAADAAPRDVRTSNVKWVTPRTYRLWRDVGLGGYDRDGLPEPGWRGRNDGRNVAFADLLFDSGLRLKEAGCLLTVEVPHALSGHSYYEGTVAAAIAKRRERMFYVSAAALGRVAAYLATTRRAAVARARREGRYERMTERRTVTVITRGKAPRISWTDAHGGAGQAPVRVLAERERRTLLIEGPDGLEPLWLWLADSGLPLAFESWEKVFAAANARCERRGVPVYVTPHMCRHSFALKMLVTLQRAMDRRLGLDPAEREHLRQVYGDAFTLVRDLLGHRSEVTTRQIYLEPLSGLRLRGFLEDSEDLDEILAAVAASHRQVIDIDTAGTPR